MSQCRTTVPQTTVAGKVFLDKTTIEEQTRYKRCVFLFSGAGELTVGRNSVIEYCAFCGPGEVCLWPALNTN